jgi:hypothetical protein
MNQSRFLSQIFEKYSIASIDKMYKKAHEILDNCESKVEILDFETFEPDHTFEWIAEARKIMKLRGDHIQRSLKIS